MQVKWKNFILILLGRSASRYQISASFVMKLFDKVQSDKTSTQLKTLKVQE